MTAARTCTDADHSPVLPVGLTGAARLSGAAGLLPADAADGPLGLSGAARGLAGAASGLVGLPGAGRLMPAEAAEVPLGLSGAARQVPAEVPLGLSGAARALPESAAGCFLAAGAGGRKAGQFRARNLFVPEIAAGSTAAPLICTVYCCGSGSTAIQQHAEMRGRPRARSPAAVLLVEGGSSHGAAGPRLLRLIRGAAAATAALVRRGELLRAPAHAELTEAREELCLHCRLVQAPAGSAQPLLGRS